MKILMLSMLAAISLWCAGPEANKESLKMQSHEKQLRTDTLPAGITDTMPLKIPLSKNPYYPDREVPSELDGHYLLGGRFDAYDLTNIVSHYVSNPDTTNMNQVLIRLDFFDMENRKRGSYDVRANNPYKKENFQPFLSESYLDASHSIVDRRAYPNYNWRKHVRQYATWMTVGANNQCETVVLGYFLQALDEDRSLLGVMSTFVLLDNKGKEIARFEDVEDVFFGEGLVTCDQKYFCFRYGGSFTIGGERMYNDHFRIYDIKSKKIIYDWELPTVYQLAGPAEQKGGWVWLSKSLTEGLPQTLTYLSFDLNNRVLYVAPEDPRLPYIRSFTEDGFIIQDPKTKVFERIWYKNWQSEKF